MNRKAELSGYASTAYRGDYLVSEPPSISEHSMFFRKSFIMGLPLNKAIKPSNLVPSSFVDMWTPEDLRKEGDDGHVKEMNERPSYEGRLDEECLKYATLAKTSWVLIGMQSLGRFTFCFLAPLLVLLFIFDWSGESSVVTFEQFWWSTIVPMSLRFLLPFLCIWGVGCFLVRFFPDFVYQNKAPKAPLWELNRRTGMVSIYHKPTSKRSGEIRVQAPFREWDGYILSLPDHQGNIWYRLVLVHQVKEWALPMNHLLAATTNKKDVFSYWDLIRTYMDVTQPLPDIPLFESYRYLDPTTRLFDKETGRPSHYWRDMADDAFEKFKKKNWIRVQNYEWEY